MFADILYNIRLYMRRHRNINDLDVFVIYQLLPVRIYLLDLVQRSYFFALFQVQRCDGHRIETGFPVSFQMTVSYDKASPNNADTVIQTFRHFWQCRKFQFSFNLFHV